MSENTFSRRALIECAAVVTAVAGLPLAASAATPDPVVALVDRFLPLYAAYRAANQAKEDAYEEHERFHSWLPSYEFGSIRQGTIVYGGDVQAIEAYYAKCIDEAETPAQRIVRRIFAAVDDGCAWPSRPDRLDQRRNRSLHRIQSPSGRAPPRGPLRRSRDAASPATAARQA